MKDAIQDFDDSAYETLSNENKYKKLVDFHSKQFESIKETMRPSFMRPEHGWYDHE